MGFIAKAVVIVYDYKFLHIFDHSRRSIVLLLVLNIGMLFNCKDGFKSDMVKSGECMKNGGGMFAGVYINAGGEKDSVEKNSKE